MLTPVILPLALGLLSAGAPARVSTPAGDPPVKVWLSSKGDFFLGEDAKAYVQSAEDGYVLVFRADAHGRVRVLFPLDPSGDQFVRGGKKYELKGRGGREAFVADDAGRGAVFAAWSKSRFAVDKFTQNGHWDFRALAIDSATGDPEAALMDLTHEMQPTEHYTYDVATYHVTDPRYANRYRGRMSPGVIVGPGWYGPRVGFSVRIGRGFYRQPYYFDPFYGGYGYGYGPYWYSWGRRW